MTDAAFDRLLQSAAAQLREERLAEYASRRKRTVHALLCAALLAGLLSISCFAASHFQFYILEKDSAEQKILYHFSSAKLSGDRASPENSFVEFLPPSITLIKQESLASPDASYAAALYSLQRPETGRMFQVLAMPAEQIHLVLSGFSDSNAALELSAFSDLGLSESFVNGHLVYSSPLCSLFETNGTAYLLLTPVDSATLSQIIDASVACVEAR